MSISSKSVTGWSDKKLKSARRQAVAEMKAAERPLRIIDREVQRRSKMLWSLFSVGDRVTNKVNGLRLDGTIVQVNDVGALIRREGAEKDDYVLFYYLRKEDEDVHTSPQPG